MTPSSGKRATAKKAKPATGDGAGWAAFLDRFDARAASRAEEQIAVRRHLHTFPEPSGEEVETTRFIAERLRSLGLEPHIGRSDKEVETGVRADLELGRVTADSPTVALRSDIDALRMTDAKTVEYRSRREGITHACGHDAHTAIVLGAAVAATETAAEAADVLAGMKEVGMRLRLIFQPSEERDGGALWMVEQGAMKDVDAILGVHVDPERPCGRVGVRYGVLTASADAVEISVHGRGGHAARPHQSIDPIAAAAHLVNSLYAFLPRRVDSRHPAVFTVGQIRGGSAPNVIPDRVDIAGTLRTTDAANRGALKMEIDRICSACELSTGVHIVRRFPTALGSVVNDPRCAAALERAAETVLGPEHIDHIHLPSMGAEDFAFYLEHAPGAMLRLGTGRAGVENPFLHSPHFDIDERALLTGTRILMRAALDIGRSIAREEW